MQPLNESSKGVALENVFRPSSLPAVDRGGNVSTIHLVCRETGAAEFRNGITEFSPGASLPLHWHNCEESVLVLKGHATFEVGGKTYELAQGDVTWAPPEVPHRFTNRGPGPLSIFWTYGSIHATRTIAATGETVAIGSPEEVSTSANPVTEDQPLSTRTGPSL